jgi:hypothetical protein
METATKRTSPCAFDTRRSADLRPSFFSASTRRVTSAGLATGSWPTSTITSPGWMRLSAAGEFGSTRVTTTPFTVSFRL